MTDDAGGRIPIKRVLVIDNGMAALGRAMLRTLDGQAIEADDPRSRPSDRQQPNHYGPDRLRRW